MRVVASFEALDLGEHPDYAAKRAELHEAIFRWSRQHHNRTLDHATVEKMTDAVEPPGILIGLWDEDEFAREFGATDVINSSNQDPIEAIMELTKGGADYAFETRVVLVGDELLAMWGVPGNQPNHASLAIDAARAMLQKIEKLRERWNESGDL